jgi:outer membrane protein OmpA-like peptidoglycan-associated protein
MKHGRIITAVLLLFLSAATAYGWGRLNEVGTSGAAWLTQAPSARLLAMGGAGTADMSGVAAWWYNAAAPAACPVFNAEVSVRQSLADTSLGFISAAVPTDWGVASLGLISQRTEKITAYDALGQAAGDMALEDGALKLGWAMAFGRWHAGLAATFVHQDFGAVQDNGLGWDAGLLWEPAPGSLLGLAVLRLGKTTEGDPLPAEVRLGGSARALSNLRLAVDLASPRDGETYLAAGLEWRPVELLAARLGWRTGPAASWQLGTLAYFSTGFGFTWSGISLDYAFEPLGVLGNAHHLSLGYHFQAPAQAAATTVTAQAAPTPGPAPAPRLQIMPRSYEGRMVLTPKQTPLDPKVKSVKFQVKDAEGRIVRTFAYAGAAVPKELVWDGKDNQGRLVDQDKPYTFAFEFLTAAGVKSEALAWPQVAPARKLIFHAGEGDGIAPEVVFRFSGDLAHVRSWRLTVVDREAGQPVRVLTGKGALPAEVQWDGRNEQGAWATADHHYSYQLELIGTDYAQAVIEHKVMGIPAEVIDRSGGRVKFKLLRILFDFAAATIRAENADKIEMAAELSGRGAALLSIQGHADEVGSRAANQILSQRRAETVRAFLSKRGAAAAEKASVEGYGKDRPLAAGESEDIRSQNRRVEIVLETADPAAAPPKK